VGEAPVIVDTSLVKLSALRMSEYYFSKGYFNNEVNYTIKSRRNKKKAAVVYNVKLGTPYQVNTYIHNATSKDIDLLLEANKTKAYLKPNTRLDFENIEDERSRLTDLLRNNGFYYFNNGFIDFQIDSTINKKAVDIIVNVRNNRNLEPHYQQTIENVVVNITNDNEEEADDTGTIILNKPGLKIVQNSYRINASILEKNILMKSDSLYDASLVQKTYANLLAMGIFKFVTIRFVPAASDSISRMVMLIDLQTAPKHEFTWEPQAIHTEAGGGVEATSERTLGLANTVTLRNRNVFGNGESFNISAFTAFEAQLTANNTQFFNSFRQNVSTQLVLPSLVFLERNTKSNRLSEISSRFTQKSTGINATYLFDRNVNYRRNLFPLSFTYYFNQDKFGFAVTPFRINLNQAIVDPDFLTSLTPETRAYTTQLLTNNIITGPIVTATWSNKSESPNAFWNLKSSPIETSGNAFSAIYLLSGRNLGDQEVLGIKYSQYARTDIDATFNYTIDENHAIVTRVVGGVGLPFGNTEFLPFERRFFVGGGNSLRAWRPRTLGPGGYSDATNTIAIEKTGEILLQANFEYRFGILDMLEGALFFDAGNIWNIRENNDFPKADFQWNRFHEEFAMNTGIGLRIDLSYVTFRIDWGIALHDPRLDLEDRWVINELFSKDWVKNNSALNFAVGYPF
jgi:outer membrane protein assembly factor BamA